MQQQTRRIVVIRHATAEQLAASDIERELVEPGRQDALEAGAWLASAGVRPEHALVSAATRARQTWELVASAAGWVLEACVDQGLYNAGPETALDLMRLTPEAAGTLVVVGHNPTIAYLANLLDDGEGDQDAANRMAMGYPAGAVTLFEYDGAWADLDTGTARLTAFRAGGR
ncbi:SixA phosphatase family protein [Nocardioides sp. MAHUQ-72]|uniref:SixA phosphatase family protein n=1 Tax=unclassified Nocardioides TaxID=2615069 RepID=UPI00361503E8